MASRPLAFALIAAAGLALAVAAAGCTDESARAVPLGPDAACPPMPAECPATLECVVETRAGGARVCSGVSCCQSFCRDNGCTACCAR